MSESCPTLKAPFPYFGGKSRVAPLIWQRFGEVRNYVELFAGSLAVLLGRPQPFDGVETVNDADGLLSNFWRATQAEPDAVAHHADWPVNENDLHARHSWLVQRKESLQARLEGDPDYFDAKAAGWWVWGVCLWIGSGWCSGKGPWQVVEDAEGVRQLVRLGDAGRGVNRQLVHLGDAGRGVNRQRVHLRPGGNGMQTTKVGDALYEWMRALADRLRRVRVCCGDWSRLCGPTPTVKQGLTAVFLDPPYGANDRDGRCYRATGTTTQNTISQNEIRVAADVRRWCLERGGDQRMRICLAGYQGEGHEELEAAGWGVVAWKAKGGYGSQGKGRGRINAGRERLWFSPHCVGTGPPAEMSLFAEANP